MEVRWIMTTEKTHFSLYIYIYFSNTDFYTIEENFTQDLSHWKNYLYFYQLFVQNPCQCPRLQGHILLWTKNELSLFT